jgi:hypothetical protein
MNIKIWCRHLLWIGLIAGACFAFFVWAITMSFQAFAPGGDAHFTEQQLRNSAIGDACLKIFPHAPVGWPDEMRHSWPILLCFVYGAALYGFIRLVASACRQRKPVASA